MRVLGTVVAVRFAASSWRGSLLSGIVPDQEGAYILGVVKRTVLRGGSPWLAGSWRRLSC